MTWNDHDHRGQYADDRHDHYDYAGRDHRHYDDESTARGLRQDRGRAGERIRELEEKPGSDVRRLRARISNMPGGI